MPNNRHRAVARARNNRLNATLARMFTYKGYMKMLDESVKIFIKGIEAGMKEINNMSERGEDERGH